MELRQRVVYFELNHLNMERRFPRSTFATPSDIARLAACGHDQGFTYVGGDVYFLSSKADVSELSKATARSQEPVYRGTKDIIRGCRVLWED
jgi:hypothetical protein